MEHDFSKLVENALDAALKRRGRVTVLIAGRSGVGKSTLINSVFQGNFAATGQGRPVTESAREIIKDGIPLSIIDTRGLEMEQFRATLVDLEMLLVDRKRDEDPNRHVHVAWLCVSEDSRRVEEGESQVAAMLAKHVPTVAVITKARSDGGFKRKVESLIPQAHSVLRVRAIEETDDEGHTLSVKGLHELVEATMEVVPEGQRNAFAAAQKVSIDIKKKRAYALVAASATAAAGVGATPLPFSDALALAPIQLMMLGGISLAFGLELSTAFLGTILSGATLTVGGAVGGPALVGALLKLVPGPGSVAGGVISAAVAAAITTAFGTAYTAAVAVLLERNPDQQPSADDIAKEFSNQLGLSKSH